jgi:Fe-S cluster biosynthesis and repair protein YggX
MTVEKHRNLKLYPQALGSRIFFFFNFINKMCIYNVLVQDILLIKLKKKNILDPSACDYISWVVWRKIAGQWISQ